MKSIAVALAVFPFLVFATCPQIEGHYNCQALGKSMDVKVTQTENIFYLDGLEPIDEVIADGQTHQVPDGGFYKKASYRGECVDGEVRTHIVGKVYKGAWYLGKGTADLILKPGKDGGLYRSLIGEVRGPFGRTPIDDKGTCARID